MSTFVTLEARILGQRPPIVDNWQVPLSALTEGESLTLRRFIERIVREEVRAFTERQEERRFERVLGARQIADGAAQGKVEMGGRGLLQEVDADGAVENALVAFTDGSYLVLIDGQQQTDLDAPITLQASSRVTFVRLVALAGG